MVHGVIMIKSIQPIHSTECLQDQAERKLSKPEKEGNRDEKKIITSENGSADVHGFLEWLDCDDSTDDDETDNETENSSEDFNQHKITEYSALSSDDSDSFLEIYLPEEPSH